MKFDMILAADEKNWIWKKWDLAWKIKSDMKYFRNITTMTNNVWKKNAVVMWYNTWLSIPEKYRPLPDRLNCILTRDLNWKINTQESVFFQNFNDCLEFLSKNQDLENIFIIGWASVYNQLLNNDNLSKIYLTKIYWDFDCDVFFDWIPKNFKKISETEKQEEDWIIFSFNVYWK